MLETENLNVRNWLNKNYITCDEDFNLFYSYYDQMSSEELDSNGKQIMRAYMEEGYAEIFVLPNPNFGEKDKRRYLPFMEDCRIYFYDNMGYYHECFQDLLESYATERTLVSQTKMDLAENEFFF